MKWKLTKVKTIVPSILLIAYITAFVIKVLNSGDSHNIPKIFRITEIYRKIVMTSLFIFGLTYLIWSLSQKKP
tara:strand:+ start:209 stop:427 length:219 start_codon:yes stop_codon:yes gene_type:complete